MNSLRNPPRFSLVIPVRNAQDHVAAQAERLLEALADMAIGETELVIVDDGSTDGTPEVLDDLRQRFPQIRSVRHPRALGFEAAGQTGLNASRTELVLVAEDDGPIRLADVQKLLAIGADHSVVAARAQTTAKPISGPLLRRLRAWGASVVNTAPKQEANTRGLQLVRRPHLDFLASAEGRHMNLQTEHVSASAQYV